MVFASAAFLFCFFPVFFGMYYLLGIGKKRKIQNIWILIGSLLFYSWGGLEAFLLLLCSILVNFYLGILIENHFSDGRSKLYLRIAIIYNLVNLLFFKYIGFFTSIILGLMGIDTPQLIKSIPLPIGISFYTFQIMSYVADVYKKQVKAQHSIIKLGVYVALFPQLIAGPIVRYIDVEKEISERKYDINSVGEGLERFIYGLTKKLVIADVMGRVADYSFDNVAYGNTMIAWLGVVAYGLQIYFDFSSYSDMAIGMGRMMGFHFMENFNYPYISLSIKEFWRRWHISLSSWFRDYVYIPLGGNRTGKTERNTMIVFFLTGLWHGASWNFIVWGLWHGIFLMLERHVGKRVEKLPKIIRWLYTFICIEIGWVFFRAENLTEALQYIKTMFSFSKANLAYIVLMLDWQVLTSIIVAIVLSYPIVQAQWFIRIKQRLASVYNGIQLVADILCYTLCMFFILGTKSNPFIYFKF